MLVLLLADTTQATFEAGRYLVQLQVLGEGRRHGFVKGLFELLDSVASTVGQTFCSDELIRLHGGGCHVRSGGVGSCRCSSDQRRRRKENCRVLDILKCW